MTHKTTTEQKATRSSTQSTTIDPNRILGGIAKVEWKELGNDGDPPAATLEVIQAWLPPSVAQPFFSIDFPGFNPVSLYTDIPPVCEPTGDYATQAWYWLNRCVRVHRKHDLHVPQKRGDEAIAIERQTVDNDTGGVYFEGTLEVTTERQVNSMTRTQAQIGLYTWMHQKGTGIDAVSFVHTLWREANEHDSSLKHPLAPVIAAWLNGQIPKIKPTRRNNTGIMPHNIRATGPTAQGELFDVGGSPMGTRQGTLPGFEFPASEIVPALPLIAYEAAGGNPGGRGRGAPIAQRLWVNVLTEYPQRECFGIARLDTTYGDLLDWLYPNGTTASKSQLVPRIREGLHQLHNLWFAWERRDWNIISVDTLPRVDIKREDGLSFVVRFPEGMNTGGGARIGLKALRLYGARSAPKFRAWVRLAYLWDAAKVRNGGRRIYATIPEVLRDGAGHLTDASGQKILTGNLYSTGGGWKFRGGKLPQTAWYHPLAVHTGGSVRNPQADKMPILDDADLVKLFYDHTPRKGARFRWALHKANEHAKAMESDGYIDIEEPEGGTRFLEPWKTIL